MAGQRAVSIPDDRFVICFGAMAVCRIHLTFTLLRTYNIYASFPFEGHSEMHGHKTMGGTALVATIFSFAFLVADVRNLNIVEHH